MVRTIIKPGSRRISIQIPADFVGKQVEVIAFTVDDADKINNLLAEPEIHFASENVLAKDWLNPEEDTAWQNLYRAML